MKNILELLNSPQVFIFEVFSLSIVAGALGGFVGGINVASENQIRLRTSATQPPRQINLGYIGDMLIGSAAGIAIIFFISLGSGQIPNTPEEFLRLVPISLMAGVVSKRALAAMSAAALDNLISIKANTDDIKTRQIQLRDQLQQIEQINGFIREGEQYPRQSERRGRLFGAFGNAGIRAR